MVASRRVSSDIVRNWAHRHANIIQQMLGKAVVIREASCMLYSESKVRVGSMLGLWLVCSKCRGESISG
jgi:hypothetical protein